ncbi:MAG TPA: hypothetical protein VED40_01005 [Azospirillaceae bacterium]|nr:hypothetical protein [Azospirillaceae bacterium]
MTGSVIIFPLARRRDALLGQCRRNLAAAGADSTASAERIIAGLEAFDEALEHCRDRIAEGRLLLDEMRAATELAERDPMAAEALLPDLRRRLDGFQRS